MTVKNYITKRKERMREKRQAAQNALTNQDGGPGSGPQGGGGRIPFNREEHNAGVKQKFERVKAEAVEARKKGYNSRSPAEHASINEYEAMRGRRP